MPSSQRGKDDSKEVVKCMFCDLKTRKDNLKRHTETQHKGCPIKWKRIGDQKSKLTDFFVTPISSSSITVIEMK